MTGRYRVDTTDTTLGDIDVIAVERVVNGDNGPHPTLTDAEQQFAAVAMFRRGAGPRTVAEAVGATERVVQRWRREAGLVPQARGEPPPCGTRSAYQRHLRRGETPDHACREANNAAHRRLLATGSTLAGGRA
ncbi:hypothetical protein [Yinghuangia soli]|uniref:Uncharacterized protein n=1 Tax=Yinghuangia soli TaxID=2908204 RepID=A0AA41U3E6_9ACTN|nr:hypothetical protein [Yinghuangia soli]MCF2531721.1 hypothetical protein [Yinghuangia soli]